MVTLTLDQGKNIVLAAAAVLVAICNFWISLDPDNYFFYHAEDSQRWRHPTVSVLVVCGIYLVEALYIAVAINLKAKARLWPRGLLAAALFLPWVGFSSMFVVHAPRFLHLHIVWTWLLLALLVLVTIASAGRHIYDHVWGSADRA